MNPTNIEPVTEADLARVAAVRCECGNPKCPTNVASDIARELAAARAAIKVAREAIENAPHPPSCAKVAVSIPWTLLDDVECTCWKSAALAQLNAHTHE